MAEITGNVLAAWYVRGEDLLAVIRPQGTRRTLHKYLYAYADPVNHADPTGRGENLQSQLTAMATSVTLAVNQLYAQLRMAFTLGGEAVGRAFNAYGAYAQNMARQVLNLHPDVEDLGANVEVTTETGRRFTSG